MIERAIQVAKLGLCLAGIALSLALVKLLLDLRTSTVALESQLQASIQRETTGADLLMGNANAAIIDLDRTIETINRPCGQKLPCGTLADVAKTLNTIRGTAGLVEVAAAHEDKQLGRLDAQETTIFDHTQAALTELSASLQTANETIRSLQSVGPAATQATNDLDRFLNSADLNGTIHNIDTTTGNLSLVTSDFEKRFHDVLYPPKCQGGWCWVKRAWPIVKNAGALTEPAYWGIQLWNAAH